MCESLLLSGTLHRWFSEILGTALTSTLFGRVLRFHSSSLLHSIGSWNDGSETRCRVNDAGIKHFVFFRIMIQWKMGPYLEDHPS